MQNLMKKEINLNSGIAVISGPFSIPSFWRYLSCFPLGLAVCFAFAGNQAHAGSFSAASDFTVGGDTVGGDRPVNLAAADFDGDGNRDLITVNSSSDDASVLLGDGGGSFGISDEVGGAGGAPFDVATADFDGDGNSDFATAAFSSDDARVLLGDGSGGFSTADFLASTPGHRPKASPLRISTETKTLT